jgi:hypothetical protein
MTKNGRQGTIQTDTQVTQPLEFIGTDFKIIMITSKKAQKEKGMVYTEMCIKEIQDTLKRSNICIIAVPREQETHGTGAIFKGIMTEYICYRIK